MSSTNVIFRAVVCGAITKLAKQCGLAPGLVCTLYVEVHGLMIESRKSGLVWGWIQSLLNTDAVCTTPLFFLTVWFYRMLKVLQILSAFRSRAVRNWMLMSPTSLAIYSKMGYTTRMCVQWLAYILVNEHMRWWKFWLMMTWWRCRDACTNARPGSSDPLVQVRLLRLRKYTLSTKS